MRTARIAFLIISDTQRKFLVRLYYITTFNAYHYFNYRYSSDEDGCGQHMNTSRWFRLALLSYYTHFNFSVIVIIHKNATPRAGFSAYLDARHIGDGQSAQPARQRRCGITRNYHDIISGPTLYRLFIFSCTSYKYSRKLRIENARANIAA